VSTGKTQDEEEEETEMGENLDGDEQDGEDAITLEPEDPLDLSLADSSQLSNEQARYLLDGLGEHLEIEGRLPIVTTQIIEGSAGRDGNGHVINHPIPAQSLEGHFISCVAETIDGNLPDDFYSLILDDDEFFLVDEVDEVARQMIVDDEQQSDQLPLLEPIHLVLTNESEAIQQDTQKSPLIYQSKEE
jgi:hypothetical protein